MATTHEVSKQSPDGWRLFDNGTRVQVWYEGKIGAGEWRATDGLPVCQDHAWPESCPFHK